MKEERMAVDSVDIRVVILAGGRGTRFWPLGRARMPKQFLHIAGRKSMVEETAERVQQLVAWKKIFTIADAPQTRLLKKRLPRIPADNFLIEPEAKNTAPSLMMATAKIWIENPEAVVVALPADHLIRDNELFRQKIKAAAAAASEDNVFVTLGIPPTFPATGYGYIRFSKDNPRSFYGETFYLARAFKEKPSLDLADQYMAQGDSYWNSGIFIWEADVFAGKLAAYAPDLQSGWEKMVRSLKRKDRQGLASAFRSVPAKSIDYALMEKAEEILVVEGNFGWSDVGSWSSLLDVWPRDEKGNAVRGESLALDSKDCLVYNPGKLTALVGVEDLIIVDTEDVLLVCGVDRDQNIREVVERLKKSKTKRKYL